MSSKLEDIMQKTYYGGAEDDPEEQEDTSTVDTDTSEIMKRLGANDENVEADEDEDESIFDSEDEAVEEANEDSDNESMESDDEGEFRKDASTKKTQAVAEIEDEDESNDSDDDDEDDEDYLQKLDDSVRQNIIGDFHPEMMHHNDEEVETLCKIVRDADGVIIDPFHKTLPFVTKYEKARILGERAKQINSGAKPFVKVEKHIIDGYLIAMKEFEEKKIPFIIRRPLPNGGSEYWKLSDLQILD